MTYAALSVVLLSALFPGGRDDRPTPHAGFNELTLAEPTRHVEWGVPLKGGSIKTLFIAPRFTLRDGAELAQRLDLQFESVPLWDAHRLGPAESPIEGASEAETRARLHDRLSGKWDVILAGNFDLAALPEEDLAALLTKVEHGAGLVLANFRRAPLPPLAQAFLDALKPADAPSIAHGTGHEITPEWDRGLQFLTTHTYGKGRVVLLDYPGLPPFSHFLLPSLEHPMEAEPEYAEAYYSLVAKATRWAANREPKLWIERVQPGGPEGPREEEIPPIFPEEYVDLMKTGSVRLPFLTYVVHLNKPADETYAVRVQVRQPGRQRTAIQATYEAEVPLRKGQQTYPVVLTLGDGVHYLDLWLLQKERVVDWHTAALDVDRWPGIEDLRFSKDSLLPNDTLGVTFSIPMPLNAASYRNLNLGCAVLVRAVDPHQRIVAMATRNVPIDVPRVTLDLGIADVLTHRLKVEVFVIDTAATNTSFNLEIPEAELGRAAYAFQYFPVRQPLRDDDFAFVATGRASSEYNVRHYYEVLAAFGVDALHAPDGPAGAFYATESNLRAIPGLTSYAEASVEDGVRTPCLTDPAFLRAEAAKLEAAIGDPWIHHAPILALGEGNALTPGPDNVCQSPSCLAGFRGYVEQDYPAPVALDDARASGVYPPWVDFRQYMDAVFTGAHTLARDILLVQSPRARVGFATTPYPTLYSGYAWHPLAAELKLLGVGPDPAIVNKVRSYRPENSTALLLCGDTLDDAHVRWLPWYAAFHKLSGVWYTPALAGDEVDSPNTALAPDGRPLPAFQALAGGVAELDMGIAALLHEARPVPPAIAVYDSPASAFLNAAETSFNMDSPRAERSLVATLEALGYAFDFVAPEQASDRLKNYKALILPMARALSDAEVETVRTFQGSIIADVAPGAYDQHGAPRETPPLADRFGVRWDGPSRPAETATEFGALPDAAVEAAGAEARGQAGDAALWLVKKDGDNAAILLNHPIPDYPRVAAFAKTLDGFLREAGLEPDVPVRAKSGVFPGSLAAFQYGKATLYALLRDPDRGGDEKLDLAWSGDGYSFDLRQGVPLRGSRKSTLRVGPGDAALVARLPYDVTELVLTAQAEISPGRRLPVHVQLKTKGGLPGPHIVRLEFGPVPGEPLPHYGRNLVVENGEATAQLPLALRERPGLYRLVAWDVLTGAAAEVQTTIVVPRPE